MIAVAAAFLLEVVQTRVRPMENKFIVSEELKQQETIMYPDLLTGIYNCTETEKGLKVVSTDPQMHFSLDGESAISNVSFYFTKPTEEELTIQVFYPDEGGGYSESHSVIELCPKGSESFYIEIPEAEYHDLRVDIDGNVIPDSKSGINSVGSSQVYDPASGLNVAYYHVCGETTVTINPETTFSVSTESAAQSTIGIVDKFIEAIDKKRAELGAVQNRLESAISNQENVAENLYDARSRIRDADYAAETAEQAKQNILQQVSSSILVSANQKNDIVLSLLQK